MSKDTEGLGAESPAAAPNAAHGFQVGAPAHSKMRVVKENV